MSEQPFSEPEAPTSDLPVICSKSPWSEAVRESLFTSTILLDLASSLACKRKDGFPVVLHANDDPAFGFGFMEGLCEKTRDSVTAGPDRGNDAADLFIRW